jgi:cytochrome c oxidase subunit 2
MFREKWFLCVITASLLAPPHSADSARVGDGARSTQESARAVHEVQVVAGRFAFEPATLHVVVGEAVRVVVRSKDGVHGFAIPTLHIDARIPRGGESVTVEFVAPPAGRYEIACSEFCGSGHGQMRAALVSVAPDLTNQ